MTIFTIRMRGSPSFVSNCRLLLRTTEEKIQIHEGSRSTIMCVTSVTRGVVHFATRRFVDTPDGQI